MPPDGTTVASRPGSGILSLWCADGALRLALPGATDAITALAWVADGQILASASDNAIWLWGADGRLEAVSLATRLG